MSLHFHESARSLTLGIEIELQVLDSSTLLLTPRANEIVEASDNPKFKQEFFQSTLEIVTGICEDVHGAKNDLVTSLQQAFEAADARELA